MQLDTELRQMLWNTRHWERVLCEQAAALRARDVTPEVAEPARALAAALEAVVLDRRHAIEMHLLSSKAAGGDAAALARARELAFEIGQFDLAARITALERKRTKEVELALVEGQAWLDAGEPDRAVKPLLAAVRARPDDDRAARALAAARREWADVRGEIDRLAAGAAAAEDDAAAARDYLHASRIARMLGEARRVRELIEQAFSRDPRSTAAYALLECELVAAGDWNALLAVYRRRCDAAASAAEVVEALRRGATRMSVTDGAPALAVRMAVRALGYAYDEGVSEIPGHLALVDIICRHYLRARAAEKLLPVIDRGLEAALPDDDAVALAIVGLDVAWSHLGSAATAQRYAARVESRAPNHPVLAEYKRGGGIARVSADPAAGDPDLPDALELAEDPGWFSPPEPAKAEPAEAQPALELAESPVAPVAEASAEEPLVEVDAPPEGASDAEPTPVVVSEVEVEQSAPVARPASAAAEPRSPIPPQATPPAPELDDMPGLDEVPELDPDELEELEDEDSSASLDESAVADPGEGLSDATGPFRLISKERAPSPPPTPAAPPPPPANTPDAAKPAAAGTHEPPAAKPPAAANAAPKPPAAKPPAAAKSAPKPPAAKPPAAANAAPKPAAAKPPAAAKSAPKPPAAKPAAAGGAGISLIPGSAKKALEQILTGPSAPPSKEAEKRADQRMSVPADATVSIAASVVFGGGAARAVTRDVSRTGAFIVTDAPLPAETKFELTLALPTADGLGIVEHELRAVVVREEPGVGYGVRFEEPGAAFQEAVSGLYDRQRG